MRCHEWTHKEYESPFFKLAMQSQCPLPNSWRTYAEAGGTNDMVEDVRLLIIIHMQRNCLISWAQVRGMELSCLIRSRSLVCFRPRLHILSVEQAYVLSVAVYTTLYRPPIGALASLSAAAIVPSLSSLMSSRIAFVTTTSVSPSTRMYSFGFSPTPGSLPCA